MTLPRVFGLGSHHGDDQAGWLIVDCLRELGYPAALLRQIRQPLDLLHELSPPAPLLICDACETPDSAGTICNWQWPTDSLLTMRSGGTHDLPLAQLLELADHFADQELEAEIWSVTGCHWHPASPPSRAVQDAAREVAARIWSRYGSLADGPTS